MCEISDTDRSDLVKMQRTTSNSASALPLSEGQARPLWLTVDLAGLGIGLVDAKPQELLYALFQSIALDYHETRVDKKISFQLRRFEIDDQNINTLYPVVLEPHRPPSLLTARDSAVTRSTYMQRTSRERLVDFSMVMLIPGASPSSQGANYVKSCSLRVRTSLTCVVC